MAEIIDSIRAEDRRYKALAEGAIAQVEDRDLVAAGGEASNSIAVLVWHVSGNLASRFTDFLTSDGEKPWRHREEEFARREVTRAELLAKWDAGWDVLFGALDGLHDTDLAREVTIRGERFAVHEALHRSLAHTAAHVGQIVCIAKATKAGAWRYLSIPPGQSDEYNRNPGFERAGAHSAALSARRGEAGRS